MESNIYAEYSKIIVDSEKWFRFGRRDFKEQLNIDTLFESTNSKNFVKQMFFAVMTNFGLQYILIKCKINKI